MIPKTLDATESGPGRKPLTAFGVTSAAVWTIAAVPVFRGVIRQDAPGTDPRTRRQPGLTNPRSNTRNAAGPPGKRDRPQRSPARKNAPSRPSLAAGEIIVTGISRAPRCRAPTRNVLNPPCDATAPPERGAG